MPGRLLWCGRLMLAVVCLGQRCLRGRTGRRGALISLHELGIVYDSSGKLQKETQAVGMLCDAQGCRTKVSLDRQDRQCGDIWSSLGQFSHSIMLPLSM